MALPLISGAVDLLVAPLRQGRVTRVSDHRPWPMPRRPWVMGQTWQDLLFAHWDVDAADLGRVVPPQLALDEFEGRAWIGVTPFVVRNLRPRLTFPLPFLSAFAEINVRTYVTVDDRPGVYFFSLDAASAMAVGAARRLYRLPYFHARMTTHSAGAAIRYESERADALAPTPAAFRARYRPYGTPLRPRPGTLEHWLIERYCLYTLDDRGRPQRAEIHHPPWELAAADADIELNTMTIEAVPGLGGDPLLHFARRQDVVFWTREPA
jgi:uncharacterized protein YqjF (DUF2071 family)